MSEADVGLKVLNMESDVLKMESEFEMSLQFYMPGKLGVNLQ